MRAFRGLLWGIGIGGVTALLLAPKKGSDLRENFLTRMRMMPNEAKLRVNRAADQVRGVTSSATGTSGGNYETGPVINAPEHPSFTEPSGPTGQA